MKAFLDLWHRLLTWLMAATVAILLIPVCLQIFSRYTELIPRYIWTEEMSRFLFIWMIMLGAMTGLRERLHFDVDLWPQLSARTDAVLRIIANVFVLAFTGIMIYWGIEFTRFGWKQTSELADLPMWLIFIAWPLTGITWFMFLVEAFVRDIGMFRRNEVLERHL
ncbi:MAG: TRAP transporter small permease [Burkholderiales bacterium]|nr:TRAP transporter small permease [Burkholderiales bacterium]